MQADRAAVGILAADTIIADQGVQGQKDGSVYEGAASLPLCGTCPPTSRTTWCPPGTAARQLS